MVRMNGILALGLLVCPSAVLAQSVNAGRVVSVGGEVKVTHGHGGEAGPFLLARGDSLHQGDTVSTAENASIRLLMKDKSVLALGARSRFTIKSYKIKARRKERSVSLKMWVGRLWARVTKATGSEVNFRVESGNAVAGVRGTELFTDVNEGGDMKCTVAEGSVEFGGAGPGAPTQLLGAMDQGSVGKDGKVEVTKVDAATIKSMTGTVKTAGKLDGKDSQGRLEEGKKAAHGGEQGPGKEGQTQQKRRDDGPDGAGVPGQGEAPPINLDPASGKTRVRVKVEVVE